MVDRYRIYDYNNYHREIIEDAFDTFQKGKSFDVVLNKDGEWVKYEDVKDLLESKIQIIRKDEQL